MPIKDVIKNFYQIESTNDPNGYPYLDLKLKNQNLMKIFRISAFE